MRALKPVSFGCTNCQFRTEGSFCDLSSEALLQLDRIKRIRTFAPGDLLFDEDTPAKEVMIVCQGAAALTFSSSDGHLVMLGISKSGEVLGLSSAISERPHKLSAEALEATRVAVIPRSDFVRLLNRFPPAAWNAGVELSRIGLVDRSAASLSQLLRSGIVKKRRPFSRVRFDPYPPV